MTGEKKKKNKKIPKNVSVQCGACDSRTAKSLSFRQELQRAFEYHAVHAVTMTTLVLCLSGSTGFIYLSSAANTDSCVHAGRVHTGNHA